MVDERLSAARFSSLGLDSEAARELADELAFEVQNELHELISVRVTAIVQRLNALGHNLRPLDPLVPGDLSYRDDDGGGDPYFCRLRLSVDTVVSTGYGHLVHHEAEELK